MRMVDECMCAAFFFIFVLSSSPRGHSDCRHFQRKVVTLHRDTQLDLID